MQEYLSLEYVNVMLTINDTIQLALVGAWTGFGSTFGVEMAKYVIDRIKAKGEKQT